MPTQLKLFSTNGSENFSKLEKEVNDWLAAKGDSIQPVNSQTATRPALGALTPVSHHRSRLLNRFARYLVDPKRHLNDADDSYC